MQKLSNFADTIADIYKPKYIFLNALLVIAYYLIFAYLVRIQASTAFLIIPAPLIFLLVTSSSVLLTMAIYSYKNTRKNGAKASASGLSFASVVGASGLCGCAGTFPILFATAIGLNVGSIVSLSNFLLFYRVQLFSAVVVLNVIVIAYYISRFSTSSCRIGRKR